MDPLLALLGELGLGVASNAVYDFLKTKLVKAEKQQANQELSNILKLHGVNIDAETVISALASKGFISIDSSHIYAKESISFGSVVGSAVAGNNTTLRTDKTAVVMGQGAYIQTQGNAQMRHNKDGSISFHVGQEKK